MLLRLVVTFLVLYLVVGYFLWPKLALLLVLIRGHFDWMRP